MGGQEHKGCRMMSIKRYINIGQYTRTYTGSQSCQLVNEGWWFFERHHRPQTRRRLRALCVTLCTDSFPNLIRQVLTPGFAPGKTEGSHKSDSSGAHLSMMGIDSCGIFSKLNYLWLAGKAEYRDWLLYTYSESESIKRKLNWESLFPAG